VNEIVCGIDEAGRGPVIGPMVIACAIVDEAGRQIMRELKVRDSKKISPVRREKIEPAIKDAALAWRSISITPQDIDSLRKVMSLNRIEALKTAQLILEVRDNFESIDSFERIDRIIVDAPDSIAENYRVKIIEAIWELTGNNKNNEENFIIPDIISENRADDNYIEVSAASVIAKVERDRQIEKLKEESGDFGSGYPSDPVTQKYIKEIYESGIFPDFIRRSWNTKAKKESGEKEIKQALLGDW